MIDEYLWVADLIIGGAGVEDRLADLERKSISIIREAKAQFKNIAVLWSTGKDSTTTLWLCKKAFFGRIPFPVIHIDSVPSYSPIIIRKEGKVFITSMDDLWNSISAPIQTTTNGEEIKEVNGLESYRGWDRWTPIKYIIRHPYSGNIIRLNTLSSVVDVTPNHSVIARGGGKVLYANRIKVGDELSVSEIFPRNFDQGRRDGIFIGTTDLAWLYGLFCAEGSAYCVTVNKEKGYQSYQITISNKSEEVISRSYEIIKDNLHVEAKIVDCDDCKRILVINRELWKFFRKNFYTSDGFKKVPEFIFYAPNKIKYSFLKGYEVGDGSRFRGFKEAEFDAFTSKSQPLIAGLIWLVKEVTGQTFSVHIRNDKPLITQVLFNRKENENLKDIRRVKKILNYHYEGYVYDIETEDHRFYSGIGLPIELHNTGYKFPEIYEFRDRIAREWNLDLIVARNEEALRRGMSPEKGKLQCCTALKTEALKALIKERGFDALILAIRRDEHGIRAKERVFSPRDENFRWRYEDQPAEMWDLYVKPSEDFSHMRVHPLLHWTELDVWLYVKREGLPVNPLYFARNGKRYRSLGCMPCTVPIPSNASTIDEIIEELKTSKIPERAGRAQDKERAYMMQKLRSLGYM